MAGVMLRVAVETPEDDIGWASRQEFVDAVFQRFTVDDERSIDGVKRFGYILVLMRVAYNERRCEKSATYGFLQKQRAKSLRRLSGLVQREVAEARGVALNAEVGIESVRNCDLADGGAQRISLSDQMWDHGFLHVNFHGRDGRRHRMRFRAMRRRKQEDAGASV